MEEKASAATDSINLRTEAIAGLTTFLTMAYIVVVNPAILSTPGTGISTSGALTATVLVCVSMTLLMGLYAKLPFAVAPGMGINAFFTYTVILGQGVPWRTALGIVFWAGVLFLAISLTPVRVAVARAIPPNLRIAAAAGIGIFLTFIGLKNAGFIVSDPYTLVRFGSFGWTSLASLAGILLTVYLLSRKSSLAFLGGIVFVTLIALACGWVALPERIFSLPDFESAFLRLDVWGALKLSLLPAIVSIMFTDLFDSLSTFMGVSHAAGLLDENGEPKNLQKGLIVDSFATFGAGLFGSSSGTAYIESVAGIEMGGRTGWTAVFAALCFLPCLFIAPLAAIVPPYATAVVLLLIGLFMFRSVKDLSLEKLEDALPAFLTVILIPLTSSITQGLLWGFISHTALYLVAGRFREIHPLMYFLSLISIGLVWLEHGNF
ncbi:MAG TPA: NCS2 family permease [Pyrinomonadaceae bacterium]|jgi:AGZA family xanthine/uracil permease-like MFS transporter